MRFIILITLITLVACKEETNWDKLSNGYEHKIHTSSGGDKPQKGEVVILDLEVNDDQGNVLDNSRKSKQRPSFVIPEEETDQLKRNPILSLVGLMSEGDSATVRVSIDSLTNPPETFLHSKYIDYTIKVYTIQDAEVYADQQKEIQERQQNIYKNDAEKVFKAYTEKTLSATEKILPSGVVVNLIKDTKAEKPQPGDMVSVNYYGFFRDGTSFDNSYRSGRPFNFTIGQGGAIQGWQMGIPEIPLGGTAVLDIPYEHAYGASGNPPVIPPASDLIFFVELENIIKAK
ncbi:FKBP-type peptidyl-prolyl cis-trans isomerase [Saprospiraceae bacterium]|nr:FKBP-type peptidyl-prolyl cis-trans isomerase [Saprospiraceae bacterium]